ncbi:MAG TPA: hypothetical protein VFW50_37210, partial [Streptosporangiaceae bacterium]|nr:hypothetical protein [Streptosporangiaceae bacterium]
MTNGDGATPTSLRVPDPLVMPFPYFPHVRVDEQASADFSVCRRTARGVAVTIPEPGPIVSKIDEMVSPAPEPENAVLTDETRVV